MIFNANYDVWLEWLRLHSQWGGVIAFLIAFSESIAVLGTIVPGSVTMTAIGILIGAGVLPLWITFIWAIAGAFLGDTASYLMGYHFKEGIRRIWPFKRYPNLLTAGQSFMLRYGRLSVFLGRFIGPIRAIIPVIAGMFNMKPRHYFFVSIPAAILWAPIYMLPGLFVGTLSQEMPTDLAKSLILFILGVLVGFWIVVKLISYFYQKTHDYFAHLLDAKWADWNKQPSTRWFCILLRHAGRPQQRGQLLTFLLIPLSLLFFFLLMWNVFHHGILTSWDPMVYHICRSLRIPIVDAIMVAITVLGYYGVVLATTIGLAIILFFQKYYRTAFYLLFATISTGFIAAALKMTLFFSARPSGIFQPESTSSFPSAHTLLATVFYGFMTFLIARNFSARSKKYVYSIGTGLILLVGVSRLYLLDHWLTDVIASWFLGIAILCTIIIAYRRHPIHKISRWNSLAAFLCLLALIFSFNLYKNFQRLLQRSQLYWTPVFMSEPTWWKQQSPQLPVYRTDRLGKPAELLNVQWVGELADIRKSLEKHGWHSIHRGDYWSTVGKVLRQEAIKYRTLLPKLYDDQSPALEMVKFTTEDEYPLIIRLWPSHIYMDSQHLPLWVGSLYYERMRKHFLIAPHRLYIPMDVDVYHLLTPDLKYQSWDIKMVHRHHLPKVLFNRFHHGELILIRPAKD